MDVIYYYLMQTYFELEGAALASGKYSPKENAETDWKKSIIFYLHDLIYMLMAILLVFLLLFRVIVVSGDSMYSTLMDGDYLLLLGNLFYQEPEQGDIVVISKQSYDHGKPIVKRVIAVEGQCVDIADGVVYVDGMAVEEPYINSDTHPYGSQGTSFPLTVAEDCIFVLGDNRGVSRDSRDPVIGQVDKREVLGKAILLMLPGTSHGNQVRDTGRIGVIE